MSPVSLSGTSLSLIRRDFPGWLGYDVYLGNRDIGHVKRRTDGREWAWTTHDMGAYIGFLSSRQEAVQMLIDVDEDRS